MNITSKVVVRKDLYLSECPTDLGQFRLRTVQSFGGKKKKQSNNNLRKRGYTSGEKTVNSCH